MVRALRKNSPLSGRPSASNDICCERSPRATAPSTRLVSAIGWVRSWITRLTACSFSPYEPGAWGSSARCAKRPSTPMTLEIRSSSLRTRAFQPTTSLNASAMSPSSPSSDVGGFTEKSPRATARRALSTCRFGTSAALPPAAPLRAAATPFFTAGRLSLLLVFPATAAGGIRDLLGQGLGNGETTPDLAVIGKEDGGPGY